MNIFGVGTWEFALIIIVALLFLGPEQMVKHGYQLGRWLRKWTIIFQETSATLRRQIESELPMEDLREMARDAQEFRDSAKEIREALSKIGQSMVTAAPTEKTAPANNQADQPTIHPPKEQFPGWSNADSPPVPTEPEQPAPSPASDAPTFAGWSKPKIAPTRTAQDASEQPSTNGKHSADDSLTTQK